MIEVENIIKTIRVTEKTATLQANLNQYTFEIYPQASRSSVQAAVEVMFDVKVARVNIINCATKQKRSRTQRGVYGRTSRMKKAIVTLEQGSSIDLV